MGKGYRDLAAVDIDFAGMDLMGDGDGGDGAPPPMLLDKYTASRWGPSREGGAGRVVGRGAGGNVEWSVPYAYDTVTAVC